jgi:hypothetical protein
MRNFKILSKNGQNGQSKIGLSINISYFSKRIFIQKNNTMSPDTHYNKYVILDVKYNLLISVSQQ